MRRALKLNGDGQSARRAVDGGSSDKVKFRLALQRSSTPMSAPAPAMSLRHDAEIIGLVGWRTEHRTSST